MPMTTEQAEIERLRARIAELEDRAVGDRLHEANGTCPRCGANEGELDRLHQRATAAEASIEAVDALWKRYSSAPSQMIRADELGRALGGQP